MPFIGAMIIGMLCGRLVYSTYKDNIYGDLKTSRLYLVQKGRYDDYNEMRTDNNGNNYVYYQDDEGYKTVVGITKNYDNVSKIKSLYGDDLSVSIYYLPTESLDSRQDEYDNMLYNVEDIQEVREVVDNILNLYQSDDSIRLVSLN